MKCPHLTVSAYQTCHSLDRPYLPSPFELHEYCSVIAHRRCPFYLGYAATAKVAADKYPKITGGSQVNEHQEA